MDYGETIVAGRQVFFYLAVRNVKYEAYLRTETA